MGDWMFDRKALSVSLHALHNSDLRDGQDGRILKDAIAAILDAIEASGHGMGHADGRHLAEAIEALSEGHEFLARSCILLILEAGETDQSHDGPVHTVAELRAALDRVAA